MKIVEIIPQLASGGAERFVVDLSNELSKSSDVFLISFYDSEVANFYSCELLKDVSHIIIRKELGFSPKLFFKLSKVLKQIDPDVIHLHLDAINYIVPFLLLNRKYKCFMTIHNDAFKEAGSVLGRNIRNFCFKTKLINPITISTESQRSFIACYKTNAPVVFNGRFMPSEIFISQEVKNEFLNYKKNKNTRILVNLARFSHVKRQPLIAKCVKRLYEEGYNFTMLMIGQNRAEDVLQEVQNYKCPALFVLGEKKNPLEYLKLADAYCLLSTYEGLPISLIEALATETIPVCTPVGGIVDIVTNGDNGLLSKDLSEDEVYAVLKKFLLMTDVEMSAMKKRSMESFADYSIENTALQYYNLFYSELKP